MDSVGREGTESPRSFQGKKRSENGMSKAVLPSQKALSIKRIDQKPHLKKQ